LLFLALDRYHLLLALLTALFFFTDTAPPEIYTLSLHDALPILTEGHVAFWQGAALAYGVVTLYVLFGGAAAVGWTNVFEGMIMMVVAWGIGIYLPEQLYGGVGAMFERIAAERPELLTMPGLQANGEAWTWGAYSTAILSSALGFAMWPHLFMKAFAAKSDRTLRRTIVLFPTFQIF